MSYYTGSIAAVPAANRQQYLEHAAAAWTALQSFGATRMVENWGEDVPRGKVTDLHRAVDATGDEVVVFSWIEWPDKATRDKAGAKLQELMKTDDRMNPEKNPMPFDGMRMIFGGFEPVVEL